MAERVTIPLVVGCDVDDLASALSAVFQTWGSHETLTAREVAEYVVIELGKPQQRHVEKLPPAIQAQFEREMAKAR